jgi:hypothetical protein
MPQRGNFARSVDPDMTEDDSQWWSKEEKCCRKIGEEPGELMVIENPYHNLQAEAERPHYR